MWTRKRRIRAMEAADGVRGMRGTDAAEVEGFRQLSSAVRSALESPVRDIPDFDRMWAGVEAKTARQQAPARDLETATGWLATLFSWRPALVVAPSALVLVGALVGWMFFMSPAARTSNQCYVDSYEAETGSVIVDQDFDDPDRPTVIWFVEEG